LTEVSNSPIFKTVGQSGTKTTSSLPDSHVRPSATSNGETKDGTLKAPLKDAEKVTTNVTSMPKLSDAETFNVTGPEPSTLSIPPCDSSLEDLNKVIKYSAVTQKFLEDLPAFLKLALRRKNEVIQELRSELEKAKSAESKDKKAIESMTLEIALFRTNNDDLRSKVEKLWTELRKAKAMVHKSSMASEVAFENDKTETNQQAEIFCRKQRVQDGEVGAHTSDLMESEDRVKEADGANPSARIDIKFRPDKTPVATPGKHSSATTFSEAEISKTSELSISKGETCKATANDNSQTKSGFQRAEITEIKSHPLAERENIEALALSRSNSVPDHDFTTPLVDLTLYCNFPKNHANEGMLQESCPHRVTYGSRVFNEINILHAIKKITIKGKADGSDTIAGRVYQRYTNEGETKLVSYAGYSDVVMDKDGKKYLKNVALQEIKVQPMFDL
jgi:hypothetical protein